MAEKVFTLSQVAHHKSKRDCWLVTNGRVLNVTEFLEEHPGGEEVLIESAGKDATKEFQEIGHSKAAQKLLLKYQVGVLQGCDLKETAVTHVSSQEPKKKDVSSQEPKKKEMEAFVVKDNNGIPKYAALLEFFLPLLVACSYFAYSRLSRTDNILN